MTATLPKIIADFNTTTTASVAVGATTFTLTSATDDDGVALPTGTYGLTIDRKNSNKEYIQCTITGTSVTNVKNVSRQGTLTTGFANTHRKGAEVIISDFSVLKKMLDLLDGTTDFDSAVPLAYDANPTFTPGSNEIATVKYADDLAIAGSPDATTSTKGISKMSVAPASAASPIAVGDNDPRVPTADENNALVGNNTDIAVGTGNKYVTQTGLQKQTECYAASTTGNDTYVVTLSPAPTSLVNGMTIRFKPDTANTGAATLNVNGLGALSIVTGLSTALATGDILANQVCEVVYNSTGTVWQLVNPASVILTTYTPVFANGSTTKDAADASTTQNIAHGLGKIPKKIRITTVPSTGIVGSPTDVGTKGFNRSLVVYNGTTQTSNSVSGNGSTVQVATDGFVITDTPYATGYQQGVVTFDATNIIITWTKNSNPTGTYTLLWEAEA